MMLVVGGRLGNKARRVGGASVNRLRVIMIHGQVVRHTVDGRGVVGIHPRLVMMGRRRTAKDGLVRLVALVWLTWASWSLHRDWQWSASSGGSSSQRLSCERPCAWKTRDNELPCFGTRRFPSAIHNDDLSEDLSIIITSVPVCYHDLRPHARPPSSSQISPAPTTTRSLTLCTLSSAGRTSSAKTGSPSGVAGAE